MQPAGDVHQAAHVGRHQRVGAARLDAGDLAIQEAPGHLAEFHREQASKAATRLRIRQRTARRALDLLQQRQRLPRDAQPAKAVTGRMIREPVAGARADVGDAEHVDDELRQLVRARGQRRGARTVHRVALQQMRRLMDHHVAAGARRHDHRHVVVAEHVDQMPGHRARVVPRARVERGLPAAGLIRRHLHHHAQALEERHSGKSNLWIDGVDEAGDQKLDARRPRLRNLGLTHVRSFSLVTARTAREPILSRFFLACWAMTS